MLQQELPPNTIFMKKILLIVVLLCSTLFAQAQKSDVIIGAEQTKAYFPILKNKRIAIFSNHTGMVGNKHLLDILLENNFNVVAIFHQNMVSVEMLMPANMYPVQSIQKQEYPFFLFTTESRRNRVKPP